MAERSRIAFVALLWSACGGDEQALRLEQVCGQPPVPQQSAPCRLIGDAQETTGITGDSLAIRFGSAGGALEIRINALGAPLEQTWSFEVLAAARPLRPEGNLLVRKLDFSSCDAVSCPEQPVDSQAALDEDFQWAVMVETIPGSNSNPIPDSAKLILEGADIDIVDIRTPGFEPPDTDGGDNPPTPVPR
jgi:hypothetical protein